MQLSYSRESLSQESTNHGTWHLCGVGGVEVAGHLLGDHPIPCTYQKKANITLLFHSYNIITAERPRPYCGVVVVCSTSALFQVLENRFFLQFFCTFFFSLGSPGWIPDMSFFYLVHWTFDKAAIHWYLLIFFSLTFMTAGILVNIPFLNICR